MKIKFDKEKCVGCYACHSACLAAHYAPDQEGVRSFRSIKRICCEDESFEKNVCPGCIHCGACMHVCEQEAIFRDEKTGLILVDQNKCTGCRKCESVCPMQVIRYGENGKMVKCDGCIERIREGREPACVRMCPTGAITASNA